MGPLGGDAAFAADAFPRRPVRGRVRRRDRGLLRHLPHRRGHRAGAAYLDADHRRRHGLAAQAGRQLAVRHGSGGASGLPRHAHRPAAVPGAQAVVHGPEAARHRVRRAHPRPGEEPRALRQPRGLRAGGGGRQAARPHAELPAVERFRGGRRPARLRAVRSRVAGLRRAPGLAQPATARPAGHPADHLGAAAARFGARGLGAIPAAADHLVRGVRHPGRILHRHRRRLQRRLRHLPRADHAAAAVDREHRAVAGGLDPQAQPLHAAGEGTLQPSGRPLQHQHHRRHAPHRAGQRRHPQRLLRVPARRLDPRAREAAPDAERAQRVEHHRWRQRGDRAHRLRPDRRDDLLRLGVSRSGAAPGRPGRADPVRAVLHRRARGLPARALLFAGAGDREPVLRGAVRQRGQPARRQQLRHPVWPELHPHAQRLPVRPRRHRGRLHAEHRDRAVRRPAPGKPGPRAQRRRWS